MGLCCFFYFLLFHLDFFVVVEGGRGYYLFLFFRDLVFSAVAVSIRGRNTILFFKCKDNVLMHIAL